MTPSAGRMALRIASQIGLTLSTPRLTPTSTRNASPDFTIWCSHNRLEMKETGAYAKPSPCVADTLRSHRPGHGVHRCTLYAHYPI